MGGWFGRVTPLQELAIRGGPEEPVLTFRDLAVAEGVTTSRRRRYELRFEFPALNLKVEEGRELELSEQGSGELELPSIRDRQAPDWEFVWDQSAKRRIAKLELRAVPDGGNRN